MQHTCPVQYDHISHKPQWSIIEEYGSLTECTGKPDYFLVQYLVLSLAERYSLC